MGTRATEEALDKLHEQLAEELTKRIKDGDIKIELFDQDGVVEERKTAIPVGAPILSVARQFLKDNHIEAEPTSKRMGDLVDQLPFDEEDENERQALYGV